MTKKASPEVISISELTLDPANVRLHPERNQQTIRASLTRFGAGRSIVLDGKNVVRAGNGTVEQAMSSGFDEVLIVEPKPNQLVAVRRPDWSPSEATAYAIADNRSAELAGWDEFALAETLKSLQSEDFDLGAVGYEVAEVDEMLKRIGGEAIGDVDGEAVELDGSQDGPKVFSDEQVINAAFHWFRENGFPYRDLPVHVSMQELNKLAATGDDELIASKLGYYIADTYNPHRLSAHAAGMKSPTEAFDDDALLRRAIKLKVDCDRNVGDDCLDTIPVVSGTQACANFRPGFACKLYREYCKPGDTVLDTSTGYGGRLVGFMASGIAGRYIGIDPNTQTHAGNARMADELGFADKVELINLPAEDVQHAELAGRCDFAFTSPPYFSKEHYSDESTQSWKRYQTGDAWRDGFLGPMFDLQFAALKPGKFSVVNIADVKIKSKTYPLASWAVTMAEQAGFKYIRTEEFPMQKRFGAGHDDEVATEPVLVFRKPG